MAYDNGFLDAAHASQVQQHYLDVISNNLANVSTPGFKADRLVFNDVMDRKVKTIYDQGSMLNTSNPLDVAIAGKGFFQVQTPKGNRLTRDGSFKMQNDGTLVTSEGLKVLDASGQPITLNPNGPRVRINDQGGIYQGTEQVGTLGVVDVADKKKISKEGSNLFVGEGGKAPATTPATDFNLVQGSVEQANVDATQEMVAMISAYRNYESYQKALQAMQDMDSKSINQVGKVG